MHDQPSRPTFRAPLWSRLDLVDRWAAVEHALRHQVCGVGGRLRQAPTSQRHAVAAVAVEHDERVAGRLERFVRAPSGCEVWTLDADGLFHRGTIDGPWSFDTTPQAWALDLTHTRPCRWQAPVQPHLAPAAVRASYARGGRNFQEIRGLRT